MIRKPLQSLSLALVCAALIPLTAFSATLGSGTSWGGWSGWTFSSENVRLSRENVTLTDENGNTIAIIQAPTFDITEGAECVPSETEVTHCTGGALFKGILKITHSSNGVVDGEAWAEFQMKWPEPEVAITITPEIVSTNNGFDFIKETRTYQVVLNDIDNTLENNAGKLTDGYKRIVATLPKTGVYAVCNGTDADLKNHLCYQEIGYGVKSFDTDEIFQPIKTASGLSLGPDIGFYWDEACVAFEPEDLQLAINGQVFYLKEDQDGKFRACEGRSVAVQVCTKNPYNAYPNYDDALSFDNKVFDCNEKNPDQQYFTLILADAAAGDRLEPAPETTCIGTRVQDWLKLADYVDEKLIITPCDPNQGDMQLPYYFTNGSIYFTSAEGDNTQIDGLDIVSIGTASGDTTIYLQESPDQTSSFYDFSGILLNNISSIKSEELDDTVIGSAGGDVLEGGNGNDRLFGFSGDDCIVGQKNDDTMWGDSHAFNEDDIVDNDVEVLNGADVFVIGAQMGKDVIMDFDSEQDVIVITNNVDPVITDNMDGTWTVALKGQNNVIVHVVSGGSLDSSNVVKASSSSYPQCKGLDL